LGWGLSVLFIACATVGFYYILMEKSHFLENATDEHRGVAIFLVYLLIVLVILFNKFVMGKVLHIFTDL
jgi:uncharacterized membrane protein